MLSGLTNESVMCRKELQAAFRRAGVPLHTLNNYYWKLCTPVLTRFPVVCRRLSLIPMFVSLFCPVSRHKNRDAAARKEMKDLREAMEHVSDSAKGLAKQRDDARAALARAKGTLRRMAPVRCRCRYRCC